MGIGRCLLSVFAMTLAVLASAATAFADTSESITIGDAVSAVPGRLPASLQVNLSDAVALSDATAAGGSKSFARSVSDSVAFADSASRGGKTASPVLRKLSDSVGVQAVTGRTVSPAPSLRHYFIVPLADKVTAKELFSEKHHVLRSLSDKMALADGPEKGSPAYGHINDDAGIRDYVAISGLIVPPSAPAIALLSEPQIDAVAGDTAQIRFYSSAAGSYVLRIKNEHGQTVRSIDGTLAMGANSVSWDGRSALGEQVPAGTYTYYLTARSDGQTRLPPPAGAGTIAIIGFVAPEPAPLPDRGVLAPVAALFSPSASTPGVAVTIIVVIAAAAAAAGAALAAAIMLRRPRRQLVIYLPEGASALIADIRQKFKDIEVDDYVLAAPETGSDRAVAYKGVTIRNAKGADDEWLAEVADKAKKLAGVDAVQVAYRGKRHVL